MECWVSVSLCNSTCTFLWWKKSELWNSFLRHYTCANLTLVVSPSRFKWIFLLLFQFPLPSMCALRLLPPNTTNFSSCSECNLQLWWHEVHLLPFYCMQESSSFDRLHEQLFFCMIIRKHCKRHCRIARRRHLSFSVIWNWGFAKTNTLRYVSLRLCPTTTLHWAVENWNFVQLLYSD